MKTRKKRVRTEKQLEQKRKQEREWYWEKGGREKKLAYKASYNPRRALSKDTVLKHEDIPDSMVRCYKAIRQLKRLNNLKREED